MAKNAVAELARAFIKNNIAGLIIHYQNRVIIRTLNSNDGHATIFDINKDTIEMWLLHKNTLLSKIAIVNKRDPNVGDELCELVASIADDYVDSKYEWPDKLPKNWETFSPADWWKYT